jgi:hypothetical protein
MVDEMARRPKLNLNGSHFKDSYLAEIECTKDKVKLVRRLMQLLMHDEKKENNNVRMYIEKCYRLLHDKLHKEWHYVEPENKEKYLNVTELVKTGEPGLRDVKNDMLLESETGDSKKRKVDRFELEQRKTMVQA